MNFRPIIFVTGILLCALGASMVFPMLVDLGYGNADWMVFLKCICITLFFGGILIITTIGTPLIISPRQGFLLISCNWLALCLFAALPLWFCELKLSFTDAFFESVSGLTTTGSTVITNLEDTPRGIILWRAIMQWLGGVGIVLMAMSVMPFLRIGGMQLFKTELSESEKALPRMATLARTIGIIYLALTTLGVLAFYFAGLPFFDATIHSLTSISTGGFSSHDASFGAFDTKWPLIVGIIMMLLGGTPFVLFLKAIHGKFRPLLFDSQVRWMLTIAFVSIAALTPYLYLHNHTPLDEALLHASFNFVSIMTGTGFASTDYSLWGGFAVGIFFFIMFVGACAGSTSCGIKIFRFQILYAHAKEQMKKLLHPHGVFIPLYNGKPIDEGEGILKSVSTFFFLYALSFLFITMALLLTGLDVTTAVSGAGTSISNVGPGLGDIIGPSGNFQPLPDISKWILCVGMLLGRLEIFPLLIMIMPQFWRP